MSGFFRLYINLLTTILRPPTPNLFPTKLAYFKAITPKLSYSQAATLALNTSLSPTPPIGTPALKP